MKKIFLIIVAIILANQVFSQGKYLTKNGKIEFEASVPAFEEIKAENNSVSAIIDTQTNDIAVLALMKAFRFKVALMEEHFNENYVESDQYPKATFTGKLSDFDFSKLSDTPQNVKINGVLNLHNNNKEISSAGLISLKNGIIILTTNFRVKPEDFDIKIPTIVKEKIAKEIIINVQLELQKK